MRAASPKKQEHDATRGPGSERQKTVMDLLRTAEQLDRYFTAFYEPPGVTPQQYNVLRILRGEHPDALPTMAIAERMVEKTPGITRLLDRLETKGWVERKRAEEDRRRVLISITAAGLELLESLDGPVREATTAVLEGLGEAEVTSLRASLQRIRGTLGER